MKRTILMSLAGLTLVAACTDTLTLPTESALEANGRLGPQGPRKDDIVNKLDVTPDPTAEIMPLNVGGGSKNTKLYVIPQGGDGKPGCNLTGSTTFTVSVSSSNATVATVSPSSIVFGSCGDSATVTVTPVSQGTATISIAQTGNTTGASFTVAQATFTANVASPANSAPTVVVKGVSSGASYDKGSVPKATCDVTDTEDGPSSFDAALSDIEGDYSDDDIGEQTATCEYTDEGGLKVMESVTYFIVDPSAPVIDYALSPTAPDGSAGWYKSPVTLTWTVTESESPSSLSKTGCNNQSITGDQGETTYSCSATSAGGSAQEQSVTIKRDATAPTVSYTSAAGTAGSNGWYISNVIATFTAVDALSGPASATQTATTSGDGASVTVGSPPFSDNAGNVTPAGTATSDPFKIDLTDPTAVEFTGGPADGSSHYFGVVPAAPTCDATDAVSGLAGCAVTGFSTAVGTHTLTATATDNAGRIATATRSYTVLAWTLKGFYQPVDMGGVLNTVKAGSTVPLKFEIFAGATELTDVASVKQPFSLKPMSCDAGVPQDDIEITTTGGTVLRYDPTGGQFVWNWQTPKTPGLCYKVTVNTQDGGSISANFKLK